MQEVEKALVAAYETILGTPMTEGIFSWLFGSSKSPSQRLANEVNDIFDRFYEKNNKRENRSSGAVQPSPYEIIRDVESMRSSILSAIRRTGHQYDKAVKDVDRATKERDKAYNIRNSYSDKLDYMRSDRDNWRKRYNEKRRDRSR